MSNNRINTRCSAIEYRSFYLVVLLAEADFETSTRSRIDYIYMFS